MSDRTITKGNPSGCRINKHCGTLIAQMHSFDGSSPQSILIMDSCSVHHVQEIQDLASVGIPLIYLPPYSPDYNPLEEAISFIKEYLKQHDELLQVLRDPLAVIQQAFNSIGKDHCIKWITHSGYN